jgi:hypothetical protein
LSLVQRQLRLTMDRWGLPLAFKVDNGSPWGSWSDLPTPLALWLIGLGLRLHWIEPRRPQQNGVAERSHGVTQAWSEPDQCHSAEELQERVNREDTVQREKYPHKGEASRWQAYPGLRHSGRCYDEGWEETHWSWQRVLEHLGEYAVDRRVDSSGKIGLYGGKWYVGTALRGRDVIVGFDAQVSEWVVSANDGKQLARRGLTQFDPAFLRQLPDATH